MCVCTLCALLFEARFHFGAQTAVIRDTPCLSLSSSGTAGQRPPLLLYFLFEFILLTTNRKFHKPAPRSRDGGRQESPLTSDSV